MRSSPRRVDPSRGQWTAASSQRAAQETQSATKGVVEGDPSRQASGSVLLRYRKKSGNEQEHGQEVLGGGNS